MGDRSGDWSGFIKILRRVGLGEVFCKLVIVSFLLKKADPLDKYSIC